MAWKTEIRALADDFCINKREVEQIIRDVERLHITSNREAYNRAWKKLFDLM